MNKTELKNRLSKIIDSFESSYDADDYYELTSRYGCDSDPECKIYQLEELNDLYCGYTVLNILDELKDIDIGDTYFCYTVYGVESFTCFRDIKRHLEYEKIVDIILKDIDIFLDCDFYSSELTDLQNELYDDEITED